MVVVVVGTLARPHPLPSRSPHPLHSARPTLCAPARLTCVCVGGRVVVVVVVVGTLVRLALCPPARPAPCAPARLTCVWWWSRVVTGRPNERVSGEARRYEVDQKVRR